MASNSVLKNKIKTVEEPVKEQEMWIFADTKCQVDKKVIFTWNSLFQEFQDKYEVGILTSYKFREVTFKRHDPKEK